MDHVIASAPQLADITPYDPKYIPANDFMSANENPCDVSEDLRREIEREIRHVHFNRYPDPLANELREMIAQANGLERDWVLVGNGGDELLFDTALAWGGPGRRFLNLPPTFSVYETNANLTNTEIVNIARAGAPDFAIDEDHVLERLADRQDPIHYSIIASPNNPTGKMIGHDFIERALHVTDALIMVDEAYFEFSRVTSRPLLENNKNLVILRTFSKAFSLAGVRIGYILANPEVIREYIKVRQPYSVDAISQAVGRVIFSNRSQFEPGVRAIIDERARMMSTMKTIPTVRPYPSDSNWILFSVEDAGGAWEYLYDKGVLVRDFSTAPLLEGMLRVTVGTQEQNDRFLSGLRDFVMQKK